MNQKTILNIYQLPENKLAAVQDVTGWGLEKTLYFAELMLTKNRLCRVRPAPGVYELQEVNHYEKRSI